MKLSEEDYRRMVERIGAKTACTVNAPQDIQPARAVRSGPSFRNKTEAAYALVLDARRAKGEIVRWEYEALTFILGHDCRYTPDFMVFMRDGSIEFHETKGFRRDDAMVKLRIAARRFPEFRFRLIEKDGEAEIKP